MLNNWWNEVYFEIWVYGLIFFFILKEGYIYVCENCID